MDRYKCLFLFPAKIYTYFYHLLYTASFCLCLSNSIVYLNVMPFFAMNSYLIGSTGRDTHVLSAWVQLANWCNPAPASIFWWGIPNDSIIKNIVLHRLLSRNEPFTLLINDFKPDSNLLMWKWAGESHSLVYWISLNIPFVIRDWYSGSRFLPVWQLTEWNFFCWL